MKIAFTVSAAFLAWLFALKFLKRSWKEALFDGGIAGILLGLADYFLTFAGYERFFFPAQLLLFVCLTIVVQLQLRDGYGNSVIAFLTAQSAFSILFMGFSNAFDYFAYLSLLFDGLLLGVSLVCAFLLKRRFPDSDWRSYFGSASPDTNRMEIKLWHIYAILVILALLTSGFLWFYKPAGPVELIFVSLSALCLFWFAILLIILMIAYKKERIEALVEQQYKNEMQSFMNVIRSQRHDYNFHVQTLAGLIREGNMEECARYVDALEKDSQDMNALLPIKDPAISALIHNFQILAARDGISIHIDIQNDLSQIATNVYETNKIISNLLQNAIDETRTHKDKSYGIYLTILKRGEFCVIRVSNTIEARNFDAEEMKNIYRQGYTTKQGHDGVGLSSIKILAEKYRGTVYTQVDSGTDVVHFVAKVPINFAKKQEE